MCSSIINALSMAPFVSPMRLNVNFVISHAPLFSIWPQFASLISALAICLCTQWLQHSGNAHRSPNMAGSFPLPYLCTDCSLYILLLFSFLKKKNLSLSVKTSSSGKPSLVGSFVHTSIINHWVGSNPASPAKLAISKGPLCSQHQTWCPECS